MDQAAGYGRNERKQRNMAIVIGLSRSWKGDEVQNISGVLIKDDGSQEAFIKNAQNMKFPEILKLTNAYMDGDDSVMDELAYVIGHSSNDAKLVADSINQFIPVDSKGRLTRAGNSLYMDGDPIDPALEHVIIKVIDSKKTEDQKQWAALGAFSNSLYSVPSDYIRKQLYTWLQANISDGDSKGFRIQEDGSVVGYKGCAVDEDGTPISRNKGHAIVHSTPGAPGIPHEGAIPNEVGSVVEMPRSEVEDDPSNPCSTGLHIGTYGYARGWAGNGGKVLTVSFMPEDVVSVPVDCDAQKLRVCRYHVLDAEDAPYEKDSGILYDHDPDDYEDESCEDDEYGRGFADDGCC